MEHLLDGLLPTAIRATAATISDRVGELLPEERPLVATAVASRQHEFSTGRTLARRLLGEFGHPGFALLRDDDRVPRWPSDVVGCVSHSESLCVVAVGSASQFRGIGLDCEPDQPVGQDVERVVCRGDEHAWVAEGVGEERGRRTRTVFSVKEAVYKAFYPRTRVFWSFQDVGVSIDLEAGRYRAQLPESAGRAEIEGRVERREGWILATTVVE